jgi:hypothetical protein
MNLQKVKQYRGWIVVLLVILFVVAVRLRMREMPLERDEGEYAYAGQLILKGIPPYKLAYNMKLPGTYAAYALIMAVFGQSASGIHLGLALVNAVSIVLVFLLARRLLDETAGVAAAVAYALMSLSPSVLGQAAHATHFVVLPALGGVLILLRASETGRPGAWFASGLLFGVTFVMKQHGIVFGVFGLICLWHARLRVRSPAWRQGIHETGIYLSGLLLPYLLICIAALFTGVFPRFIFWTITYPWKYISLFPLTNATVLFRDRFKIVASPNVLFWVLGAGGAIFMWWEKRLEKHRFFLTAFFFCSFLSIGFGLYFRAHYFILLLPAISLLAGLAVSRGLHLLRHDQTIELFLAIPILVLFLMAVGFSLVVHSDYFFTDPPKRVCQRIYRTSLFPEAVNVGQYLKEQTTKDATIAVLGSEPEIYFYAGRRSATGYIYMYPLMERHNYAGKMLDEMIREIENARPEYIVYVNVEESWFSNHEQERKLHDWWTEYWNSYYDLVRTAKIEHEKPDSAENTLAPDNSTPGSYILILKRKESAGKNG